MRYVSLRLRQQEPPRPMGNCSRCCYAARKVNGRCVCARYPKWIDIEDMNNHFCGEFVSQRDYAAACNGEW